MTVLIAYASKHGSTREIAEHIAKKLWQMGMKAEARSVDTIENPESYEAVVIGSAIYYGSWLKAATEWVHRNQAVLAARPVWLFSCGPLGTEVKDAEPQPRSQLSSRKLSNLVISRSSSASSTTIACLLLSG